MKSGKTYLGTYDKDSKHAEFKYQGYGSRKILNSNIKELRLGNKSKVVKVLTPFYKRF